MKEKTIILCAGPFPALQRTLFFQAFREGEVNRAARVSITAAGKPVNVARAVQAMGGAACISGFRGGATGKELARRMREEELAGCLIDGRQDTRTCQTLVDMQRGRVTELVEESTLPDAHRWEIWINRVCGRLASTRMLVLSGTLPAGAPADLWARLSAAACERRVPVVIDSHGPALLRALSTSPWLVKPNGDELASTLSLRGRDTDAILRGMRQLLRRGAQHVIVTRGSRETLVASTDESFVLSPPPAACRNPVGCGDTFTGVLAHAVSEGQSLPAAARLATAAATARCTLLEPGAPSAAMVRRWLPRVRIRRYPAAE